MGVKKKKGFKEHFATLATFVKKKKCKLFFCLHLYYSDLWSVGRGGVLQPVSDSPQPPKGHWKKKFLKRTYFCEIRTVRSEYPLRGESLSGLRNLVRCLSLMLKPCLEPELI